MLSAIRAAASRMVATPPPEPDPRANPEWVLRTDMFRAFPNTEPDVAMVGDSIVQLAGDWSVVLPGLRVTNFGVGGDTVRGVLARTDLVLASRPRRTFLMIGINDIMQGRRPRDLIADYCDAARALAAVPLSVLMTTNPVLSPAVAELNRLIRSRLSNFIDLTEALCPDGVLDPAVSFDGVHINAEGYRRWRDLIQTGLR